MQKRKLSSVNFENEQALSAECPFNYTLSLIGKRWKPAILWKMYEGVNRFGQMKKAIPQISEKMLSQHLRELENDGLVTRTIFPEIPPKVEYTLTDFGKSLEPVLGKLYDWGEQARKASTTASNQED
ncbi:MAG TPA: transcriptional regulator [Microscillaceae bacterium]|nr:transcriptional regulator [Microscillaceae bacterium]